MLYLHWLCLFSTQWQGDVVVPVMFHIHFDVSGADEHTRPVVLLAPLADPLIRKLMSESPDKYKFCEPCESVVMCCIAYGVVLRLNSDV